MKKIALVLVTIALFSCAKEKASTCWTCTYSTTNGTVSAPYNECNNGDDPKPPSVDANGNDLSWLCNKK